MMRRSVMAEGIEGLRQAFDQAFAARPNAGAQDLQDLLSVRIAGEPYALRLAEMSGLSPNPRITPVPSAVSELLGLTAIRGVIFPVYSLAEILGHGKDGSPARWVSVFGTHEPLGLTFGSLEGYARISSADLWTSEESARRQHLPQVSRIGALICPVISLASVAQTIKGQAPSVRTKD